MCDDHVEAQHQQQQGEAALKKPVQGSSYSAQSKESHHLRLSLLLKVGWIYVLLDEHGFNIQRVPKLKGKPFWGLIALLFTGFSKQS